MKKFIAIAAGLMLVGQTTFALAATDAAFASKAPTAHARAVNQCTLQQRRLVKADQVRAHATNRCNMGSLYFGTAESRSEIPIFVGAAVVAAVVIVAVVASSNNKPTSP